MAFSNPTYLSEIRRGIERFEPNVMHLCLVAPLEVVHERLRLRGTPAEDPKAAWQYRRASECCDAHRSEVFAEQISTAALTAAEVADLIVERALRTT